MAARKPHTTPSTTHCNNSAPQGYLSPALRYSSTPTNPPMPSLTYPVRQSSKSDAYPGVFHRKNLFLNLTNVPECTCPTTRRYSRRQQSYTPSILPLTVGQSSRIGISIQNTMITSSYPIMTVNDVHSYLNPSSNTNSSSEIGFSEDYYQSSSFIHPSERLFQSAGYYLQYPKQVYSSPGQYFDDNAGYLYPAAEQYTYVFNVNINEQYNNTASCYHSG